MHEVDVNVWLVDDGCASNDHWNTSLVCGSVRIRELYTEWKNHLDDASHMEKRAALCTTLYTQLTYWFLILIYLRNFILFTNLILTSSGKLVKCWTMINDLRFKAWGGQEKGNPSPQQARGGLEFPTFVLKYWGYWFCSLINTWV